MLLEVNALCTLYPAPCRNGYKMCIRAYLNGDGIGYKTHLSVFFVLMKGEFDPLLKWPFDYKVGNTHMHLPKNEVLAFWFKEYLNCVILNS